MVPVLAVVVVVPLDVVVPVDVDAVVVAGFFDAPCADRSRSSSSSRPGRGCRPWCPTLRESMDRRPWERSCRRSVPSWSAPCPPRGPAPPSSALSAATATAVAARSENLRMSGVPPGHQQVQEECP